ncbi:MBL fold metallo-hydrolase [Merismopedia glauca]|uniref:MBL fold metallo-hydrolase n=1 Tax=Merismopedia glauca CCAP 1448/3 TaxID=1296344 RepID=A0A2T1C012_9CYAN|nr:MBL fold metallo-hydrolase [Merismopedia glauca]PSB01544.1 MBL fold metallo-hydrolase [Merismopedia glauca CCAP 1448/3]
MKSLHCPHLFAWSTFDTERNIDFNSIAWIRPAGNILIDPLPLSEHDWKHLQALGGAAWIILTNSDHIRASQEIASQTSAQIAAPSLEQSTFPIPCNRWLQDGDEVVEGLQVIELHGSKTPGELALLLEETTLITGDLVRAHQPHRLMLLPDAKLKDKSAALASLKRLAELEKVETVLVGDGWSIFSQGHQYLHNLANLSVN